MMIPNDQHPHLSFPSYVLHQEPNPSSSNSTKRKRSLPGNPDPEAEVISLSPNSLIATNRFICEICNKGFKRDQNLQLHRRGHNLPWKLKQRVNKDQVKKKVYVCPHESCVHHDPARALGDLTGIKKHFSRKHGEKKWKCDKCSKKYAVLSDWKAHSKICGTKEYRCDCGTLFSRKDSFITHRAFCDALAGETARFISVPPAEGNINPNHRLQITTSSQLDQPGLNNVAFLGQSFTNHNVFASSSSSSSPHDSLQNLWNLQGQASHQWLLNENKSNVLQRGVSKNQEEHKGISSCNNYYNYQNCGEIASMSATALLQKAAQIGTKRSLSSSSRSNSSSSFGLMTSSKEVGFTRDFLGVGSQQQQRSWPLLMVNRSLPDFSPPVNTNRDEGRDFESERVTESTRCCDY